MNLPLNQDWYIQNFNLTLIQNSKVTFLQELLLVSSMNHFWMNLFVFISLTQNHLTHDLFNENYNIIRCLLFFLLLKNIFFFLPFIDCLPGFSIISSGTKLLSLIDFIFLFLFSKWQSRSKYEIYTKDKISGSIHLFLSLQKKRNFIRIIKRYLLKLYVWDYLYLILKIYKYYFYINVKIWFFTS